MMTASPRPPVTSWPTWDLNIYLRAMAASWLRASPRTRSTHPTIPLRKRSRAGWPVRENLKLYHQKTRENIQKLFSWVEAIEAALPVERSELWSEGEENFEARLDAIQSQH